MQDLPFSKGHGLGNDYLVVDSADLAAKPSADLVRAICDRHRGVGSDGLLVGSITESGFELRIYNPDGSEAEKSGNGLRIFGAYLYGQGLVQRDEFDVHLVKDTVQMRIEEELEDGALMIRVAMGRAQFIDVDRELALANGVTVRVTSLSLSNPHCVVFTDTLDRADFLERAPQLCKHEAFARGTNVQYARVIDDATLQAWIWERGVGETLASGSSSCAVAAAAVRNGLAEAGPITVHMPGGAAGIEVSADYEIRLRAPAQIVMTGVVRGEVIKGWIATS